MKTPSIGSFCSASLIFCVFFVPVAIAQIGPPPPPPPGGCQPSATLPGMVRAGGLTELVGLVLTCSPGTPTPLDAPVPAVDLTVILNAPITSRLYANGWSEVTLVVDEPNSGQPYTSNTQLACANSDGICPIVGTGTGQGTYDGTPGRPNVFSGQVSGNSVIFPSVPFDAPAAGTGLGYRTFRIMNLRVNAADLATGSGSAVPVVAAVQFSGGLPVSVVPSVLNIASVVNSADFSLRSPNSSGPANSTGFAVRRCDEAQRVGVFRFAELTSIAFETRTFTPFVDSETSPVPVPQNNTSPAAFYPAESGFYNPALTAPTVNFGTVGLADAGTRLRATIDNIPAGAKVFVSTTNVVFPEGAPSAAKTGTVARLVRHEATAFAPTPATRTLDDVPVAQLRVLNDSAVAVWEVLGADWTTLENYDFAVWVRSGSSHGSATITGSLAPAPPAFSLADGNASSATLAVPRFVSIATGVPLFNTNACEHEND